MRKYAVASGLFTAGAGAVGFLLRQSELTRGFEPDTGLPVPGAASTAALVAYSIFVLAAAMAVSAVIKARFKIKPAYREAFAPSDKYVIFTAMIAAVVFVSGAMLFVEARGAEYARSLAVLAVLTVASGVAIFCLAADSRGEKPSKASLVCVIIPELYFTAWLLLLYRSNQTNPVRLEYVFQALAAASSALASYFTAAFVFGRPSPIRAVFSHIAAVYFLATAAADGSAPSQKIAFIAFAAYFAVNLARLIDGLEKSSPRHLKGSQQVTVTEEEEEVISEAEVHEAAD
ncbi:MAG: hypothetical protein LBC28_03945 [Oscillospiraceae bacterium]|jgi:hypothetical protein|nr:hypothetical protein [Oscillospiraceae bacterium]